MTTPDNKRIIIPNGGLANNSMINFSAEETRRADFVFGIGYDDDVNKAKAIVLDLLKNDARVLKEPAEPFVRLGEMADSSVNLTVRAWVKASDYWAVHFDMNEAVYEQFNAQGISIPYPQMDVHVNKLESA